MSVHEHGAAQALRAPRRSAPHDVAWACAEQALPAIGAVVQLHKQLYKPLYKQSYKQLYKRLHTPLYKNVVAMLLGASLWLSSTDANAQTIRDTTRSTQIHSMPAMQMRDTSTAAMSMSGTLGIPMNRSASGTAWIPDAVSLPTREFTRGAWDLMLHGFAYAQYDNQSGERGGSQFGSINWGMLMASRAALGGQLQLRGMLSLDALGVSDRGYPLLLQSGETYHGQTLHDRQHPHDVFMELGVSYTRAINPNVAFQLYAAPAGEPALGAVAFMHRPSAMDDPVAPIGHHWQDATHVSFGVVTAGIFTPHWKFEGSAFNAREPDENRWNIELNPLESYSARLTINPSRNLSLSTGFGSLHNAERHPVSGRPESLHRTTVALQHGMRTFNGGQWATTLMWSRNAVRADGDVSQSYLVESEWLIDGGNTLTLRVEQVEKSVEELSLPESPRYDPAPRYNVKEVSFGYIRELVAGKGVSVGVGARGTVNVVPDALGQFYGTTKPVGAIIFFRLRAARVTTASPHEGMSMDKM